MQIICGSANFGKCFTESVVIAVVCTISIWCSMLLHGKIYCPKWVSKVASMQMSLSTQHTMHGFIINHSRSLDLDIINQIWSNSTPFFPLLNGDQGLAWL